MRERPIIFDAESVRSILAGGKTQTRRVVKPQPAHRIFWNPIVYRGYAGWTDEHGRPYPCPYGLPGDRLWVREAWRVWGWTEDFDGMSIGYTDGSKRWGELPDDDRWQDWMAFETGRFTRLPMGMLRSPIFMPRWASRISLEIVDVRVEQLHSIDEDDLLAEGAPCTGTGAWEWFIPRWDGINKRRGCGWDTNPWVFVVDFRRVGA